MHLQGVNRVTYEIHVTGFLGPLSGTLCRMHLGGIQLDGWRRRGEEGRGEGEEEWKKGEERRAKGGHITK